MQAETAFVAVARTGRAAVVEAGLGLLERRGLLGCRGLLGLLADLNVLSV